MSGELFDCFGEGWFGGMVEVVVCGVGFDCYGYFGVC